MLSLTSSFCDLISSSCFNSACAFSCSGLLIVDILAAASLRATFSASLFWVQVELAPSTNTDGYNPGCILAQYTGGANAGKFVNYDPAGTNGQNIAALALVDEYITPDVRKQGTQGKYLVHAVLGGAAFDRALVYFNKQNGTDNIAPAIAQIGGKIVFGKVCLYAVGR